MLINRWAEGEEYKLENMEGISVVPLTRPAGAGHPLPFGEGFAQNTFQSGEPSALLHFRLGGRTASDDVTGNH